MVGIPGKRVRRRIADVTASARSLPSLTCGTAGGSAPNEIGVWPATVDPIANAATTERDVHNVELKGQAEQFAQQMRRSACSRRGVTELARAWL